MSEEVARGDGEEETLVNSVSLLLHLNSPRDPLRLRLDSRKSSVAGVEDVFFEDPNLTSGFYQVTSPSARLRPLFVMVSKKTRKMLALPRQSVLVVFLFSVALPGPGCFYFCL